MDRRTIGSRETTPSPERRFGTATRARRTQRGFDRLETRAVLAYIFDAMGENPIVPHPVAGQPAVDVVVATFVTGPSPSLGATIDWGDGFTSAATLRQTGEITPEGPVFEALGTHTYTSATLPGLPRNVTVTVHDQTDSPGSPAVNIISGAVVDDAPILNLAGTTFAAAPGVATSTQQDVATFASGNPYAPASSFAATIDGGDGSPTGVGQVVEDANRVYHVEASHAYAAPATYPVTVSILSAGGSSARTATPGLAVVASPAAGVTLNPVAVTTTAGVGFNGAIATFAAPGTPGDLATISWGDGMAPTPGTVVTSGGSSVVVGSHTYAVAGSYPVSVVVQDPATGASSRATTQAAVAPNAIALRPGPVVTGVSFDRLHGRVVVTFASAVGLDQGSATDAANYLVSRVNAGPAASYLVTGIRTIGDGATTPETVIVSINHNRPLRGGLYSLTIRSGPSGIVDLDGGQLQGSFYGTFPSGNGRTGGDFAARLAGYHRTTLPPMTVVGTARPTTSPTPTHPALPAFLRRHGAR